MDVWTEHKEHSIEGHTLTGTLKFKGEVIWGPHGCHENTMRLGTALNNADWRFAMTFESKEKSVEGHDRYINVKDKNGAAVLNQLSTHVSLDDLARAVMKKVNSEEAA
ncbi:hypothetical protein LOZ58_004589 [Ophidiomyces ophidiicola]|nr:hypothetical protein LOZ65_004000 [Ophidiomyces ophidiicola]KAI1934641.1 hypothetical protein LOZ66_005801 [Ophidiomyces ophidiicola]KAI1959318.1 hypothetical protein LOZ58_004589 [Ophidiomyces ophidiicola]